LIHIASDKIIDIVGGKLLKAGDASALLTGVSTDTRSLESGDVFFALSGEKFDAHDFLDIAADRGAGALIVSNPSAAERIISSLSGPLILVDDTLKALQDLAAYYKKTIAPYTIGVTGSVGKSGLKEMINCVITGAGLRAASTAGNFNSQIGLPLSILYMPEDTEVLTLEMGMSHSGEIAKLAGIARPEAAVITNVGISHRENFKDDDGIFRAKMEIASYFGENETLVINADDAKLSTLLFGSSAYRIISCGKGKDCEYRIGHAEYDNDGRLCFSLRHSGEDVEFVIPQGGCHLAYSAALAAAVVAKLGISPEQTAEYLRKYEGMPHRLQLFREDMFCVVDDTYNACPDSMKTALDYLMSLRSDEEGGRSIAVLAGMNELGDDSRELHRMTGEYASLVGVDILIAVGDKAGDIYNGFIPRGEGKDKIPVKTNEEATDLLKGLIREGDRILVKGSRSYATEEIVARITKQSGETD